MYFRTKNATIFQPEIEALAGLYKTLEKYAPVLDGSPIFEDLVEVYETLVFDLEGD